LEAENENLLELIEHQKKVVNIINEVSSKVNSSLNLATIFKSTFQLLDQYFQFKHIMILLVNEEDASQLKVAASHGYDGRGTGAIVPFGKGVIGMVAKNKKLLRMGNIRLNLQFMKTATKLDTNDIDLPGIPNCISQLAVPLLVHDDLVGVIAVESTSAGLFDIKDEELIKMIGVQIGIAINNAGQFKIIESTNAQLKDLNENLEHKVIDRTKELAKKKDQIEEQHSLLEQQHDALGEEQRNTQKMLEKIETLFGQQVSEEIVKELITQKGDVHGKAYNVTIMFLDIRDFTRFADSRDPEELASFQNIVFGELIDIVRKQKGNTIQLLGDGILAVFGAPVESNTHVTDSVTAGYAIIEKVNELADKNVIPKIRLGIGLHCGKIIAGNIGNAYRKAYSLTGTTVIIASRIEQLNKAYNSEFLVSEDIYQEIKNPKHQIINHGEVELKGIKQAMGIYQLV
jgi:class 3 adenylate cyclase/putative methionine-R-sulfoxide reductase with GAF domain